MKEGSHVLFSKPRGFGYVHVTYLIIMEDFPTPRWCIFFQLIPCFFFGGRISEAMKEGACFFLWLISLEMFGK